MIRSQAPKDCHTSWGGCGGEILKQTFSDEGRLDEEVIGVNFCLMSLQ